MSFSPHGYLFSSASFMASDLSGFCSRIETPSAKIRRLLRLVRPSARFELWHNPSHERRHSIAANSAQKLEAHRRQHLLAFDRDGHWRDKPQRFEHGAADSAGGR